MGNSHTPIRTLRDLLGPTTSQRTVSYFAMRSLLYNRQFSVGSIATALPAVQEQQTTEAVAPLQLVSTSAARPGYSRRRYGCIDAYCKQL
jgi:hypothetical protein